ncbi:MAG: hydrogen gas-evolving membrane-bound hydrogenase subunit E [Ilumatobacter sp.]|uniref:hydrogen gas-evolving membrane-bound hydrogenase subunit E n=1 Tax=Ilumatobacter sp. TaxID=1967498 RepID=UPI00391CD219
MIALLLAHLFAAVVCLAPGRRSARWALPVAAIAPAITFGWLVSKSGAVLDGDTPTVDIEWVPQIALSITLRLDGFGLLMGLIVSGIGVLVLGYSMAYFGRRADLGRLAGLLVAFAGAMLGIVWADGLLTLFVFWELTTITSFLLIGFDQSNPASRFAATRAFLVTGVGGLALLAGLIILTIVGDTTTISGLAADPPTGTLTSVALVLVLVGAFTKSAQFPFHFWLPGAMAAPTPVSAYLHSATMVKAGLVVVARFAPTFASEGPWRELVVVAGLATLFLGGIGAMRQQDAKLALAYGTVSQLGFLMVLLGLGTPATTYAGIAMLLAHALFKASLFLSVGVVDHEAGTRDMRRLRGLARALPVAAAAIIVAAASMAAIPPTFGFVTKEKALDGLIELARDNEIGTIGTIALIGIVLGSVLTVAYTIRITVGLLGNDAPGVDAPGVESGSDPEPTLGPIDPASVHRPPVGLLASPVLLALASLAFGFGAGPVGDWLASAAASLDPATASKHLVLWPGVNEALLTSTGIIAAGIALWWFTRAATRHIDASRSAATAIYDRTYDGLLDGARRITATTQSGSLPLYLAVVLSTVAAALLAAIVAGATDSISSPRFSNSPIEFVAVVVTGMLAVAIVFARNRFGAAVLLGGSGYGLAIVYLIQGAPDLAITQFLVETLTIVVFLLVLARLPSDFSPAPAWAPKLVRIGIATAVGVTVAVFALSASSSRTAPSVGEEYVALSEPEAGGRNVVNVILVDFRGFDTLGEIVVLAVAGAGVINLVRAARREQRRKHLDDGVDIENVEGDANTDGGLPIDRGRRVGVWR